MVQNKSKDTKRSEESSQSQLIAILEHVGDAIVVADANSKSIVRCNASAAEMFGLTRSQMAQTTLDTLIDLHRKDAAPQKHPDAMLDVPFGVRFETIGYNGNNSFPVDAQFMHLRHEGATLYVGIIRNLTKIKGAERRLRDLNDQLVRASRQAGMAEIATGVLHNVGNILNSINVSAEVVHGKLARTKLNALPCAIDLLEAKKAELSTFLTEDKCGKMLIPYLRQMVLVLQRERQDTLKELSSLQAHIEHVKTIVSKQQSYAHIGGMIERCRVSEVVEDALALVQDSLDHYNISVVRKYHVDDSIVLDRHKMLQILVNLLSNSKQALRAIGDSCPGISLTEKVLTITIDAPSEKSLSIAVSDNGIGIRPEHIDRIFINGFTTKPNGHGFGLHHSLLAAQEMDATLCCTSGGFGCGATFTLEIPRTDARERARRQRRTLILTGSELRIPSVA